MKKFDEFINENQGYFYALKGAFKNLILTDFNIEVDNVYVYEKDDMIRINFVKENNEDIRKVGSLELGLKEAESYENLYKNFILFRNKHSFNFGGISSGMSTDIKVEFYMEKSKFMKNQFFRSIVSIDKYNL